jgi:hypothetical protein
MRPSRHFLAAVAIALAISGVASRGATADSGMTTSHPQVGARASAVPTWIKNVARRLVDRKIRIGELPRHVGKEALTEWLSSGAKVCPSYLPAPYFCPRRQVIWSRWGIGYGVSWYGKVPAAWTSPTSPRRFVYALTAGVPYWLTCWTYGDRSGDGRVDTSLWYRLRSGNYVNDAWFETGTNSVIPGVAHC